jgi:hypothetical protein
MWYIFRERLTAFDEVSKGVTIAIIPDEKLCWTAVFPKGHRGRARPMPQEQVDRVQRDLRRIYELPGD